MQRELYEQLVAAGDKAVYFLPGEGLIGDDGEAIVDYVHQTDLGQLRYARNFVAFLEKEGIKF